MTCRHQRVAVRPAPSLSDPLGHGHERCRRQVAILTMLGRLRLLLDCIGNPEIVEDGTPAGGAVISLPLAAPIRHPGR